MELNTTQMATSAKYLSSFVEEFNLYYQIPRVIKWERMMVDIFRV